ncbi:MAG: ABC transporter substrate-binding protein, partial [Pseudomonadota bacterium]
VEDKGDALRAEVREELDGAAAQIAAVTDPKRAMFILSMRDNRVMASGTETAANGILGLAGAQNVISEFTGYKQLSDEAVITAAPDVIVMMRGRGGSSDHAAANEVLQSHPALSTTPAVKNGNIIRVDGLLMLGFGPRTGQAALELAKMIYPDELN